MGYASRAWGFWGHARLAWPFETTDLLLRIGESDVTVGKDGSGQTAIYAQLRSAVQSASSYDPLTLRLARDTTLVDVRCWVPQSTAPHHGLTLQETILKTHDYLPLPSAELRTFADIVVAATKELIYAPS